MTTSWLNVSTADGPMHAYLAEPDGGGPYPGILVLQEAFGVNGYVRSVADRLADAGFVALAPELFHRQGVHVDIPYGDSARIMAALGGVTNATLEEDCGAALAALRQRTEVDPERLGVVGFCMGGFAALLAGLTTAVRAVVAFYPGGVVRERPNLKLSPLLPRLPAMRAATLVQLGGDDASIPPDDARAIEQALQHAHGRHAVAVWPGAKHGFHSQDREAVYHPQAAEDAWHRTLDWFEEVLRSAP